MFLISATELPKLISSAGGRQRCLPRLRGCPGRHHHPVKSDDCRSIRNTVAPRNQKRCVSHRVTHLLLLLCSLPALLLSARLLRPLGCSLRRPLLLGGFVGRRLLDGLVFALPLLAFLALVLLLLGSAGRLKSTNSYFYATLVAVQVLKFPRLTPSSCIISSLSSSSWSLYFSLIFFNLFWKKTKVLSWFNN